VKRNIIYIFIFNHIIFSQPPNTLKNYKLFINEEFNNDSYSYDSNNNLILKNWDIKDNFDNWGGSSIAIFLKENVKIENNHLVIYTEYNNPYSCPPPYSPASNPTPSVPWSNCNYTLYPHRSGYVASKFQTFYGYYEIKARMDYKLGHWPAFWLHAGSCATYSEIDIFENISDYSTSNLNLTNPFLIIDICSPMPAKLDSGFISSNVHFPRVNPACNINQMLPFIKDMRCTINGFSFTDWHTYGFEYWPHKFAWYIDGKKVREINNIENYFPSDPFNFQYFNVILNSSVDPFLSAQIQFTTNVKFEIVYFRYYTFDSQCSNVMVDCYDFHNHNNEYKLSYNIGGSCYNLVPTNRQFQFLAKNDIKMNKDFHAPLGADIYMEISEPAYCFENHATTYPSCGISLISCNYHFDDYNNLNRKYIQLGGTNNCSVLFPSQKNIKLYASEYIELKPGVIIPDNSDVGMKIINCP
jgi:hypothetical protein